MKHIIWTLPFTIILLNCSAQDLLPFHSDTVWGYRNKQGLVKIGPQFQYASKYVDGIAIVAKNEKFGAIDEYNNIIVPFRYGYLRVLDSTEFLFGYRTKYFGEHLIGVMRKDGKIKIPTEYNYISKYSNSYIVTKNVDSILGKSYLGDIRSVNSLNGLLDINGKVVIPCKYDHIRWVNDSLIVLTKGGLGISQALFSKKGEQLTGFDYMVFGEFLEGVAKARIGNKFGFIYPTGKVAIPIMFDFCEDFNNGYALIRQGDKWGAIDKKGMIMIQPTKDHQEVTTELHGKYGR